MSKTVYEFYATLESGRMYSWSGMLVAFSDYEDACKFKAKYPRWRVLMLYVDSQDNASCRLLYTGETEG